MLVPRKGAAAAAIQPGAPDTSPGAEPDSAADVTAMEARLLPRLSRGQLRRLTASLSSPLVLGLALFAGIVLFGRYLQNENAKLRERLVASELTSRRLQSSVQQLTLETSQQQNTARVSADQSKKSETNAGPSNAAISEQTLESDGSEKDDAFLGPKDAPVVVMLFSDYLCNKCREFHRQTLPKLKSEFADTGKVKIIYRDLPLQAEGLATAAAQFAQCVGEQGKYWDAFAQLSTTTLTTPEDLDALASSFPGLDTRRLQLCSKGSRYTSEIAKDRAQGIALGASGAPDLYVARNTGGENFHGVFIRGAQPYPVIQEEILKVLQSVNPEHVS
jgi:protein-disulfide isomerase